MTQTAPASASPHRTHGIALMLLSTTCFTANILLIRAFGNLPGVNVWFLVCTRFLIGLLVIGALYWREFEPRHLWENPRLIARGIVGGLGTGVYYLTIVHLGAGRSTFIGNTYVVWGGLLAVWVLRERLTWPLATGSLVTLTGLGLLTNVFSTTLHPGFYDLLALLSAFASATVIVLIRQLHAREHTSTIFAAQCVYGLLICGGPAWHYTSAIPVSAWLLVGAAGLAAAIGQLSMTRAFRELPVGEGALLQMLVPLGVAVGGVLLFQEHYSVAELLGAALILGGTVLPTVRRQT